MIRHKLTGLTVEILNLYEGLIYCKLSDGSYMLLQIEDLVSDEGTKEIADAIESVSMRRMSELSID